MNGLNRSHQGRLLLLTPRPPTLSGPLGKQNEQRRRTAFAYHHNSPEYQAMSLLGLEPPLDLDIIKKRYKELAKEHHPDRNAGSEQAAERLKDINAAYKISKIDNLINSIVVSVNEINASFTIDKKELPASLRFDMDMTIDPIQIPEKAKVKFFILHW